MRSGRILLALLLLIGSVVVFIGTAIYSRFLFLGVFLTDPELGMDALGGKRITGQ